MRKKRTTLFWSLILLVYFLAVAVRALSFWFNDRFGVGIDALIFTLNMPLAGSDAGFMVEAVVSVLLALGGAALLVWMAALMLRSINRAYLKITLRVWKWKVVLDTSFLCRWSRSVWWKAGVRLLSMTAALGLLGLSLRMAVETLDLENYRIRQSQQTTIYEDYYVDPAETKVTLEGKPKNLIYIYLESMETTYASKDVGGAQEDINYIPNLTRLAQENLFFSDTDRLGGGYQVNGASWTMGALMSSTSGLPFAFPVRGGAMGEFQTFGSGIYNLGDLLQEFGYRQVFLCGSEGMYGGRQSYFEQHGDYEVQDLYYAREQGYIAHDYEVWWGYEDRILYDIAKTELQKLAQGDQPFNYTMLTVDTHHVDGYVCPDCPDTYDHQLGNVLVCSDRQIMDFIRWCQEQPFYENTVIVITGDHYRMDASLVEGKERRLYNCFLNTDTPVEHSTQNRIFASMDLFPTTLAAMGFEIEGDRLGLGTNLFSDRATLAEEKGLAWLDEEAGKSSDYYVERFS